MLQYHNIERYADYNTTANSWLEQRTYLTDASKLIAHDHPELAGSIDKALASLKNVQARQELSLLLYTTVHHETALERTLMGCSDPRNGGRRTPISVISMHQSLFMLTRALTTDDVTHCSCRQQRECRR